MVLQSVALTFPYTPPPAVLLAEAREIFPAAYLPRDLETMSIPRRAE